MFEEMDPIQVDAAKKALYQLTKQPGFDLLLSIIQQPLIIYSAAMPKKSEDKVAFETASYVCFTVQEILGELRGLVSEGEQLTIHEETGENDAEESRHNGELRRSRA